LIAIPECIKAALTVFEELCNRHDGGGVVNEAQARVLLSMMDFDDVSEDSHQRQEEFEEPCARHDDRRTKSARR
jgi:hypothetical protein